MRLLVVGGGPAGVTAALQGREIGVEVSLLEADQVGGTSLNTGPAPVRTLARSARLARDWSSWADFGLEGPRPVPNFAAMVANSDRVARYAHDKRQMVAHLRQQGIDVVDNLGPVRFIDPHTLCANDDRRWYGDRIVLAVGCRAASLRVPGAELALSYTDIRSVKALPQEVAVVGGADTGCQIASILADLGAQVWLFEADGTLVPTADVTVSTELGRAFEARGIMVQTDTLVQALESKGDRVRLRYLASSSIHEASFDAVFVAVGWPANIEDLALDAAGIISQPGSIPVDQYLRTNVEHIFAAGDVNGISKLVQTARLEGRIAARNAIEGPTREFSYEVVPSGSFTDPEYGRVGLTEAEATRDHDTAVGIARYDDLLRPVADGRPSGFCKLIADQRNHTVLGADVLGEYSAEIVQVVAACMAAGMTVEQVAELQFAFPTFTEAVGMAAQKICRRLGIGSFPLVWSYLGAED